MTHNSTPSVSSSEAVIFTTGQEVAEKFRTQIHLTADVIARATRHAKEYKSVFTEGLYEDIQKAQKHFAAYQETQNKEDLLQVKRLVLALKSNAGMADRLIVTEMSCLLFELFDDGYDMQSSKVQDSVVLYLQTIGDMLARRLNVDVPTEVHRLLDHFRELNHQIR
jgi:chemotaxis protein histidine kinase CheA